MRWHMVKFWIAWAAIISVVMAIGYALIIQGQRRCERAGGHTINVYKGWICVSDDGRVIEP